MSKQPKVERPMLLTAAVEPVAPAQVQRPVPAVVAKPETAEWAPRNEEEFVNFFLYLLQAPIVGHPDWVDTLKDKRDRVTLERMLHHNDVFAHRMCCEYEAMLYISTVTLAYPVNHDWYVIYGWLFRKCMPDQAKQIGFDDIPERLNINQLDELNRLREWIFKQQQLHLKGKRATPQEKNKVEAERPRLL